MQKREERGGERFRRAASDHRLRLPIEVEIVETLVRARERLAKRRHAHDRRVLIVLFENAARRSLKNFPRPVFIGKALAEIDRAMLVRKRRHDGEDRDGAARESRVEGSVHHRAGPLHIRRPGQEALATRLDNKRKGRPKAALTVKVRVKLLCET